MVKSVIRYGKKVLLDWCLDDEYDEWYSKAKYEPDVDVF